MGQMIRGIILAILVAAAVARSSHAQEISASINSTQALMGETLLVQVQLKNPTQASAPEPPQTDAFEIRIQNTGPQQSSSTYIVNNRRWTDVTYTYSFTAQPLRAGQHVLPPFVFREKGQTFSTEPITVRVSKHIGGDFLLAEVKTGTTTAYVGQPLELTLEIWVKQYERDNFRLDVSDMWQLLMRNRQMISLGVFEKAGTPKWKPGERKDEAGKAHEYFVYLLETTVYPERPGPLDLGEISLAMNYPITLRRDVFGRISVDRDRMVQQRAKTPAVEIKAIPTQGRPPDFSGAVGRFSISASAKPTESAVGDPVTLTLSVRGQGTPLDRLSAPKLTGISALLKDFEISGDSPAGEVEGDRKVFAVTIRPLREDVTQIPPLPMSYFDSATGAFGTAWSKAIPIKVRAAEKLALPTQLNSPSANGQLLSQPAEATEGLIANFTDPNQVLANQDLTLGAFGWALLLACPVAYFGAWFATRRAQRFAGNETLRRTSRAYAIARRTLAQPEANPATLRSAFTRYIADKFGSAGVSLTRDEAVQTVRDRGLPDSVVAQVDALLEALEAEEYGGNAAAADRGNATAIANGIEASRVRSLIDTLEATRAR